MTLTRTRQFGLVRSAPAVEGTPKVFTFRANDGQADRYQDRNKVAGWKTDAYKANPVVLLNHNDRELPIGKGRAYAEGDALMVDIEFDQADDLAKRVEGKVEGGFLNAVSVRYLLQEGKFRSNELGGIDSDEQELLEISIVTIPGNQRAVRVKGLETPEDIFEANVAELAAIFQK
jgi:HK97 family phage prohead protease